MNFNDIIDIDLTLEQLSSELSEYDKNPNFTLDDVLSPVKTDEGKKTYLNLLKFKYIQSKMNDEKMSKEDATSSFERNFPNVNHILYEINNLHEKEIQPTKVHASDLTINADIEPVQKGSKNRHKSRTTKNRKRKLSLKGKKRSSRKGKKSSSRKV